MQNIIQYTQTEFRTFDEKPFNDVDSLILSQTAYLNFDDMAPSTFKRWTAPTLHALYKAESFAELFKNTSQPEQNQVLFAALCASPRFRDIKVNFFAASTDEATEKQFSATTFLLPDKSLYLAFRGTDCSLVGWKEDFNMSFMTPVPSQEASVIYLEKLAAKTRTTLRIGGHSKGGNLAVYAAAFCKASVQQRITKVYSHDGPGFTHEFLQKPQFANIAGLVSKTLPQSSLVGMLLETQEAYAVVQSDGFWIAQHDPYTWQIENGDFFYVDKISNGAGYISEAIHEWLSGLSDTQRAEFVDILFRVLGASGTKNVFDFNAASFAKALEALKDMDPEMRNFLIKTATSLAALSMKHFAPSLPSKAETGKQENATKEDA